RSQCSDRRQPSSRIDVPLRVRRPRGLDDFQRWQQRQRQSDWFAGRRRNSIHLDSGSGEVSRAPAHTMLTFTGISRQGRRPQTSLTAGWVLYASIGALVATLLSPPALRAQTPAGTQITSITMLSFVGQNGLTYTTADTLTLLVGLAGGADVLPPRSVVTDPSTTVTFAHTVTNIGNGTDGISVMSTSRSGWVTRVYRDTDNSGTLTAGDQLLTSPMTLALGASAA